MLSFTVVGDIYDAADLWHPFNDGLFDALTQSHCSYAASLAAASHFDVCGVFLDILQQDPAAMGGNARVDLIVDDILNGEGDGIGPVTLLLDVIWNCGSGRVIYVEAGGVLGDIKVDLRATQAIGSVGFEIEFEGAGILNDVMFLPVGNFDEFEFGLVSAAGESATNYDAHGEIVTFTAVNEFFDLGDSGGADLEDVFGWDGF